MTNTVNVPYTRLSDRKPLSCNPPTTKYEVLYKGSPVMRSMPNYMFWDAEEEKFCIGDMYLHRSDKNIKWRLWTEQSALQAAPSVEGETPIWVGVDFAYPETQPQTDNSAALEALEDIEDEVRKIRPYYETPRKHFYDRKQIICAALSNTKDLTEYIKELEADRQAIFEEMVKLRSNTHAIEKLEAENKRLLLVIAQAARCVFAENPAITDTVWISNGTTLYEHLVVELDIDDLGGVYEDDLALLDQATQTLKEQG